MSTHVDHSPKDLVKTGYDKIAPAYQDFITNLPSPNLLWTDKLLAALPSPTTARILELGCGPGIPGTKYLAARVGTIVANDISPIQIALARQNLSSCTNISFKEGDMASLTFGREEGETKEATFDAIVAMYSLQHLPRDEQPEMLRRVYEWLRPGGVLLCNFDENEDPGSVMEDWLGVRMFSSGFGVEGSKGMVREVGFEIVEAEVVGMVKGERTVPFLWVLGRKG